VTRGREILVGVVILLAAAVAVVGTLWLQEYGWGRGETVVQARFRDVGQLMMGNDVKFRGVSIGRVESIEVEPGGQAVRVAMRIQGGVDLPDSAVVVVAPESMFGDWQVEITTRSRYPRFDFAEVPPDSTVLPGFSLPDISRLTATAEEIAGNLRTLSERVEMAFTEETARNIADAIDNIQAVSQRLAQLVDQQAGAFEELSDEIRASAQELGGAARAARSTFERVDGLLDEAEMDSILADTRDAMENLRRVSGRLEGTSEQMTETLARADSAFGRIERITGRISDGEGTIGRLLTDSTLAVRAAGALTELELLLADFRENPRRYVRLSIF